MPIRIEPFVVDHIPEVKHFNERLQTGGAPAEYVFFETPEPAWLPRSSGGPVYNELFLALDGAVVRGTYALKRQPFLVQGEPRILGFYHHPFSEGIVSRAYGMVGALLLNDVMRRQPLTYCLGMGGYDRPLPLMLIAMKWKHFAVPFRFRILRPYRFLRGMETLRKDPIRRLAADLAAFSGTGWAAIRMLQAWKGRAGTRRSTRASAEVQPSFGPWADEIWTRCSGDYPLIAVRDRATLNFLFPQGNPLFTRLRITVPDGQTIGWAVVSTRKMEDHPQYGNLRVGQIIDALGHPEDAGTIIGVAADFLRRQGADVATCNHSHAAWVAAMDASGFLTGPSNFIFAAPPAMAALLAPFNENQTRLFFTRADGDGLYRFV